MEHPPTYDYHATSLSYSHKKGPKSSNTFISLNRTSPLYSFYTGDWCKQDVLEGYNIRIYDIDRCVCDAIKFRNKIGMDVCSEIIDNYLVRPERNISKLLDYARQLRVGTILENYLQIRQWVNSKIRTTENKSVQNELYKRNSTDMVNR